MLNIGVYLKYYCFLTIKFFSFLISFKISRNNFLSSPTLSRNKSPLSFIFFSKRSLARITGRAQVAFCIELSLSFFLAKLKIFQTASFFFFCLMPATLIIAKVTLPSFFLVNISVTLLFEFIDN